MLAAVSSSVEVSLTGILEVPKKKIQSFLQPLYSSRFSSNMNLSEKFWESLSCYEEIIFVIPLFLTNLALLILEAFCGIYVCLFLEALALQGVTQ